MPRTAPGRRRQRARAPATIVPHLPRAAREPSFLAEAPPSTCTRSSPGDRRFPELRRGPAATWRRVTRPSVRSAVIGRCGRRDRLKDGPSTQRPPYVARRVVRGGFLVSSDDGWRNSGACTRRESYETALRRAVRGARKGVALEPQRVTVESSEMVTCSGCHSEVRARLRLLPRCGRPLQTPTAKPDGLAPRGRSPPGDRALADLSGS